MNDREYLTECGICHAAEGQPCNYPGTHVGRRWEIGITHPGSALGTHEPLRADHRACRPTVESTYRWDHTERDEDDWSAGELLYRGACLGCGWHGPEHDDENDAVEDAHDHAWPTWRTLPVVPRHPHALGNDHKSHDAWVRTVTDLYTAHGIPAELLPGHGAPIRTYRVEHGTRSHWAHETKGYDLNAGHAPEHVEYSPQLSLFV